MKTLLLLAGRSKRFWPLSEKTLFPLCGKTLLQIQIEKLREGGCDEIIVVGGEHNLDDAKSQFPDMQMVQQENLELGMQGALLSALPVCGSEQVMIVSGNDVIDSAAYIDLQKAASNCDGALLAQEVDRYFPGGYIAVENNRITSIVEKPGEGNEPSNLVNIVAHIHNDASVLLDALTQVSNKNDDGYEVALDSLFKERSYAPVPYKGQWNPVKFPWHLLSILPVLLDSIEEQSIHATATVHPSAVIDGNVVLDEGVRVMPHATVVGPCYIGKNSIVANNALVRNSSIGDNCVVGYNTEVKGSVFHSHVWTHSTYVGDSICGHNVSFGAGSVTGNLRLDEGEIVSLVNGEKIPTGLSKFGTAIGDNCRLGIHTSTNPGVKIGADSFVGGNTLVTEDVPVKSFVTMKDGKMNIRENKGFAPPPEDREKYKKTI